MSISASTSMDMNHREEMLAKRQSASTPAGLTSNERLLWQRIQNEEKLKEVERLEREVFLMKGEKTLKVSGPSERLLTPLKREKSAGQNNTNSSENLPPRAQTAEPTKKVYGCSARLYKGPPIQQFLEPPPPQHLPLLAARRSAKVHGSYDYDPPKMSQRTVEHLHDHDVVRRKKNAERLTQKVHPKAKGTEVVRTPIEIAQAGERMCNGAVEHKKKTMAKLARAASASAKKKQQPTLRLSADELAEAASRLCDGGMARTREKMKELVKRHANNDRPPCYKPKQRPK